MNMFLGWVYWLDSIGKSGRLFVYAAWVGFVAVWLYLFAEVFL